MPFQLYVDNVLYFQGKRMTYGQTHPSIRNAVVTGVQIIIGLLLIGNQRQLVNFIERKRRNTVIERANLKFEKRLLKIFR